MPWCHHEDAVTHGDETGARCLGGRCIDRNIMDAFLINISAFLRCVRTDKEIVVGFSCCQSVGYKVVGSNAPTKPGTHQKRATVGYLINTHLSINEPLYSCDSFVAIAHKDELSEEEFGHTQQYMRRISRLATWLASADLDNYIA